MPTWKQYWIPTCIAAALVAGCTNNPYVLQGQVQTLEQQQQQFAQRNSELLNRASALDRNNQELETLLAQAQRQNRMLEDQIAAMREQLSTATTQLARLRTEGEKANQRVEALEASVKKRPAATITANNSLEQQAAALNLRGVDVRNDGDVVRIELPGNQLFEQGGARLLPHSTALIDHVAAEVARVYPNQIIGIEGHTDNDPIGANSRWGNNHQLSVGRAMAVFDQLTIRGQLNPNQLFVVGHGPNHPVASNGTPSGKERNRRVEIVIYPERYNAR